jgi:DNA-binding response OmpR family regulator
MATVESTPPRRRVLIVDDNPGGRRALARYLELQGYEVSQCGDGASALRSFASAPPPDIVLTDMMLPDMDGREIGRQAHDLSPRPLVVLVTGWSIESAPGELDAWGIDLVFQKPINIQELLEKIRQPRSADLV